MSEISITSYNVNGLTKEKQEVIKNMINQIDIILLQEIKKGSLFIRSHHTIRSQNPPKDGKIKRGLITSFNKTKFKQIEIMRSYYLYA